MSLKMFLFLLIYNSVLPILGIIGLPMFLIKTARRKGFGSGIREKFGIFSCPPPQKKGGIYVHAVSVGETLIAIKWIRSWQQNHPETPVTLAIGTSTGHALAKEQAPKNVTVIYAPLDFWGLGAHVLSRFSPSVIVLIEAELWPNFAYSARKRNIPIVLINARLSERSERRYKKLGSIAKIFFSFLDSVGVQDQTDAKRFENIGVSAQKISITGSIKFDQEISHANDEALRENISQIVNQFHQNKTQKIVLAASTHAGEELLIASAIRQINALPIIVPRHAERRNEIKRELEQAGFHVFLRSENPKQFDGEFPCLIVDVTGELRLWYEMADLAIIGKSFLAEGGQNPAEALVAGKPVIVGPNMQNFSALIDLFRKNNAIVESSAEELPKIISQTLNDPETPARTKRGQNVLLAHSGATRRSVELVERAQTSQNKMI